MFQRTDKAVSAYKKEIEKLKKELRAKFIEELKKDIAEFKAEFPNLDKLFIIGYTPEFNDGEECVHQSEIFFENREGSNSWYDMRSYVERMYWDSEVVPDEFLYVNINLTSNEVNKIRHTLLNSGLESDLHDVFDTNFHIIIDMTEENVDVFVEDYECGY